MTHEQRWISKIPVFFLFLTLFLSAPMNAAFAINMGDSLVRDYPVSLPLPKHRLEISMDYFRIDSSIDVFDITEIEESESESTSRDFELSGMSGFKAIANFGVFENTTLNGQFIHRDIEYGRDELTVRSIDFSIKQTINNRRYGNAPYVSISAGFRTNAAEPPAFISDNAWEDRTPYARLILGGILGDFFPNLFFEYGYTAIESGIESSYVKNWKNGSTENDSIESADTSRNESTFSTGACILVKFPYTAMTRLEYRYIRLFRDDFENEPDDNHIVKFDINYFITERFIFNLGNIYYHRQFNGVIPSIFNPYTQNSFDQNYFRMHIGITVLFGID